MHELKITEAVIEEIIAQAHSHDLKKIEKVVLSLGSEADFTEDEIKFCFETLVKGTSLEEVDLEFKEREGREGLIIESIEGER